MLYLISYISGDVSGYYDELYDVEGHFKTSEELIEYANLLDMNLVSITRISGFSVHSKFRWVEYRGDNYRFDYIYIFDDSVTSDIITNGDLDKVVSDYKSSLRENKLNELGIK
jgi:hypothetical protein